MNPLVAEIVDRLSPEERELWEERVAIMVVDAGYREEYAQSLALLTLLQSEEITTLFERKTPWTPNNKQC